MALLVAARRVLGRGTVRLPTSVLSSARAVNPPGQRCWRSLRRPRPLDCAGATASPAIARARARARDAGALRDRVRERRLVDLLRARRHRGDRARADAARLRHHRADLRLHRRDLRRGHGALPRGGRLVELRAPRVQRARLVRGRVGADAELRDHGRHLGVLRAALPLDLLGAAADEPVGRHRRHRGRARCSSRSTSSGSRRRRR